MILDYFKLTEEPFGVTPDPRFLYLSQQHREAMASLAYGTEAGRGFLALIAQPGMGKTSLIYQYLESLRGKARTAFLFRTDCDSREFMRHLLLDLDIDSCGRDLPWMHESLNRVLLEEMNAGRRFVLVIDEAQNLEEHVLESVRLLSNFETPWAKLIQIVIAGQPQLAEILKRPSAAQVRQRISMVIRIEPLSPPDVDHYIDHRLRTAGCKDVSIFTTGARLLIAEHSGGIPRNINNLCFNAMSLACALKHEVIDRNVVLEVLADLDLESLVKKPEAQAPSIPALPSQNISVPERAAKVSRLSFQGVLSRAMVTAALVLATVTGVDKGGMRSALPGGITAAAAGAQPAVEIPGPAVVQELLTHAPSVSASLGPVRTLAAPQVGIPSIDAQQMPERTRPADPRVKRPEHADQGQQTVLPTAAVAFSPAARLALEDIDSSRAEAGKQ
jgi:type II secretory pathway predicted ATPase ExeA